MCIIVWETFVHINLPAEYSCFIGMFGTNESLISRILSVKPNIQVLRAKFSEITPNSIRRACDTLSEPDSKVSDAVDVRQELDLRIGTVTHLNIIYNTI